MRVLGVHESPDLDGWVALQLDRDLPAAGTLPEGIDLGGLTMTDLTGSTEKSAEPAVASFAAIDQDVHVSSGWVCRWFPSLPGCRR